MDYEEGVLARTPLYRLLRDSQVPIGALVPMTKYVNKLRHLADDIRTATGLVPGPTTFEVCVEHGVHEMYAPPRDHRDYSGVDRHRAQLWREDYLDAHPGALAIADVSFRPIGEEPDQQMVISISCVNGADAMLAARVDGERHGAFRRTDESDALENVGVKP